MSCVFEVLRTFKNSETVVYSFPLGSKHNYCEPFIPGDILVNLSKMKGFHLSQFNLPVYNLQNNVTFVGANEST